jgi:hypothetical protein
MSILERFAESFTYFHLANLIFWLILATVFAVYNSIVIDANSLFGEWVRRKYNITKAPDGLNQKEFAQRAEGNYGAKNKSWHRWQAIAWFVIYFGVYFVLIPLSVNYGWGDDAIMSATAVSLTIGLIMKVYYGLILNVFRKLGPFYIANKDWQNNVPVGWAKRFYKKGWEKPYSKNPSMSKGDFIVKNIVYFTVFFILLIVNFLLYAYQH